MQVLTFTASRRIMGEFTNSLATNMMAGSVAVMVMAINLTAVYEVTSQQVGGGSGVGAGE